jgi:hypothetical protein
MGYGYVQKGHERAANGGQGYVGSVLVGRVEGEGTSR